DPRGPVHQGRARLHHHARAKQGRARAHARLRRGGFAPARPALPSRNPVRRRHGLCCAKDLRHRGLVARAERVSRDFLLLELRGVPGAAHERALPAQGRPPSAPRPHAQRFRRCRGPRADRGHGDLPAAGRIDRGARRAAALYGRTQSHRAAGLKDNAAMTEERRADQRSTERDASGLVRRAAPQRKRILITNDDGIHSEGLDVCVEIARALSDDVWVLAPEFDQSGVSHSLSLNDPLRLREIGERRFAVKGTPTDCVIMGAKHVIKDHPPDLVLSGVNRGRNAGEDVIYSGTVAGAVEGTILGIPSLALSQSYRSRSGQPPHWETAIRFAPDIIRRVLAAGIPRDVLINVNFPDCAPADVKGIAVTSQGRNRQDRLQIDARQDGRGNAYYWIAYVRMRGQPPADGSDISALADNRIAVTPLRLDMTDD